MRLPAMRLAATFASVPRCLCCKIDLKLFQILLFPASLKRLLQHWLRGFGYCHAVTADNLDKHHVDRSIPRKTSDTGAKHLLNWGIAAGTLLIFLPSHYRTSLSTSTRP